MADVVVSPLLQVVLDKLATPFLQRVSDLYGIREEVKRFLRTLPLIHAVLADAQARQLADRALRLWLADLKDLSYDLEDLIDEFSPEAIIARNRNNATAYLLAPLGLQQPFNYVELLPKLNQVKTDLEALFAEKSSFGLREGFGDGQRSGLRRGRQTGSFVVESEVFGREEDRERVVEVLVSGCGNDVMVVSVVGLGGLGKTTLARLVYNDERVLRRFDMRIWVCVNDEFDMVKVMIAIVEAASRSRCEYLGMDVLQFQLRELLLGKKWLLVMDDVWDEEQREWDELRALLSKSGAEGSAVLVTSRSEKVAVAMGTTLVYKLGGLSEESCWGLFKQRAFGRGVEERPSLLSMGRRMVSKCGGVPLAVKTLGSLMSTKRDEREWMFVVESDLWDESQGENGTMAALRLSYNHLPPHLKGCFAFCSIFPNNYVIEKEKLIQMWIAAGFIQSPEGKRSLEFIGNEYFNDLVWRFFFHEVQKDEDGTITECKIHDLIHELAQSVAGSEFMRLEQDNAGQDFSSIRHSSVVCSFSLHTIPEILCEAKKLRTLILLLPKGNLGEVPSAVFSSFRYLRVLDLNGSGIKRLHESISSFVFLKYLDLSNTHIQALPESVCGLSTLQVMNLSGCHNIAELPSQLRNLSKLRHLNIAGCEKLTKMPGEIGKLIYLQTLSKFIVGTEAEENIDQLGYLNLGGELEIRRLENVRRAVMAKSANLLDKRNLQSLALSWGNHDKDFKRDIGLNSTLEEQVLYVLQPHKYLKSFSIKGYAGSRFPKWIEAQKLPNLTRVTLVNCRSCEYLPALGQLPLLKVVCLRGMDAVQSISSEFYGDTTVGLAFPSLVELSLSDFSSLVYWWTSTARESFPALAKLTVNKCPRLNNLPSFPSLTGLELRGCNDVVLRSASNLTSLTSLVVEEFPEQLVFLDLLLQNNPLLMSLKICSCPKLRSISPDLGKLVNLRTLTLRWCEELISLPRGMRNLTALESLEIIECHSLVSLPETMEGLVSLRSLSIENCGNISSLSLSLQGLSSLEHLTVMYCPKLYSLPKDWRHLSTLKSLSIMNCPGLVSLPEGLRHATSLQNMEIRGCPGLRGLPEWVAELTSLRSLALSECRNVPALPHGFECLSFLQHLSIRDCPRLEERCEKDVGEDWPKTTHVSHVYIGSHHFEAGGSRSSSF